MLFRSRLVKRDRDGHLQTVRYDLLNAILLNEFLKEHRKVEQLQKQLEVLAAALKKVSAKIESDNSASQIAINNE